ncbi:MAG: hypothetical protein QG640_565 [Patescibacteria group bacterium]|nr:hypothetical protein [Patescibacteria group bacterium]
MLAIFTIIIGTLLSEIAASIGKFQTQHKKETIFQMGFLEAFWPAVFFISIALYNGGFYLDPASFPTFFARMFFETIVFTLGLAMIIKSDRSTSAFLTILTIPLLLLVDTFLGYEIGPQQIAGILIVVFSLVGLYSGKGLRKSGSLYAILWALGAAITISLYKYNVTHYNSVAAEQGYAFLMLLIFFFVLSLVREKKNPIPFLFKYPYNVQSLARGVAMPFLSFAYIFAPASIILTGKRAFSVLWAILSGGHYFNEKKLGIKILYLGFIIIGLILAY